MKKYQSFLPENFQFLEVKFSLYLNRRIFVIESWLFSLRCLILLLTNPKFNPCNLNESYTAEKMTF